MSGFLLDTNIPSETVRPRPEPKVQAWLAAQPLDTLFISAVSFGELRKGIALRTPGQRRTELETWIEGDLCTCFPGAPSPSPDPLPSAGARWTQIGSVRAGPSISPMA